MYALTHVFVFFFLMFDLKTFVCSGSTFLIQRVSYSSAHVYAVGFGLRPLAAVPATWLSQLAGAVDLPSDAVLAMSAAEVLRDGGQAASLRYFRFQTKIFEWTTDSAVGASARCRGFCSLWGALCCVSRASSRCASFFCVRELLLGARASSVCASFFCVRELLPPPRRVSPSLGIPDRRAARIGDGQ